jgi:hypothetical protein
MVRPDLMAHALTTGPREPAVRRYTLAEVEAGSRRPVTSDAFHHPHPLYPDAQGVQALQQRLNAGDEIWYFEGLDSGWAIVRQRKVVFTWVTSHDF